MATAPRLNTASGGQAARMVQPLTAQPRPQPPLRSPAPVTLLTPRVAQRASVASTQPSPARPAATQAAVPTARTLTGAASSAGTVQQPPGRVSAAAGGMPKDASSAPKPAGPKSDDSRPAPTSPTMATTTAVRPRGRYQREAEPEGFWERWWPFAFAVAAPAREQLGTKESNKRRRERIKRLRKYDEGRDFEQFTDSYQGDSSGSIGPDEVKAASSAQTPDTPAGHYSKAHPYYKKLRLPSGRRVDITRRNYFLRKWRDKKVKTTYYTFYVLFFLIFVVVVIIYAYKENMPWLYKFLSGLRDVAQGTRGGERKTTAPYYGYPLLKAGSAEDEEYDVDEDHSTDYATETGSDSDGQRGTRGIVFDKDDMRKKLV